MLHFQSFSPHLFIAAPSSITSLAFPYRPSLAQSLLLCSHAVCDSLITVRVCCQAEHVGTRAAAAYFRSSSRRAAMLADSHLDSDENDRVQTHPDNKYKCTFPECKAAFPRPSRLQRHINVHTNERPYKCTREACDKTYTNSSHLKRHLESHNSFNKSLQCHICQVSLSTLSNLKRHFKRAHNSDRELYCLRCKTWFTKKNRFEEHMQMHENSSKFKCLKCGRVFHAHLQLTKHQARHHGPKKNYQCPVDNCTRVFDQWLSMVKHKRTQHPTEYTCSICDQTFTSKGQFRAHNKIHSNDRPAIACPYEKCCRLYYYRRNLNNHIRSKHQGNRFTCDVCGIGVSSKQKVKEHIIKMHMNERKASKRKAQALRKDSGAAKVSVISLLTGVQLGVKAGIQLMKRKPTALLRDQQLNEDGYSSFSEDDKAPSLRIQGA